MLGRVLFAVAILGIVAALCGCPPAELPEYGSDNTSCVFDGYEERAVRGRLRTSFDYKGGECRCDCDGIPVDLLCTISATISEGF